MTTASVTGRSNIEPEFQHIPILDLVFLTFDAELARLAAFGSGAEGVEIGKSHGLGGNESSFEIAMDDTGGSRSFVPGMDGPGAGLFRPIGEVGAQSQQGISGTDELADTAVGDAQSGEVFLGIFGRKL